MSGIRLLSVGVLLLTLMGIGPNFTAAQELLNPPTIEL